MKSKNVKAALALMLSASMLASMTGCSNSGSGNNAGSKDPAKPSFTMTEESTYQKPLLNQPEVPYWFPNDLLAWSPDKDEDAKYNVSTIPLAKRVDKEKLIPSVDTQVKDMNVVAISIMNSSTSGNAPHGINTVDANVFSYWQYIDKLVYWGGSSGEGLIVTPSADVIDAAHKNGVPVMGTVFFPQPAHGGKIEWLNDFLKKDENGNFPMIDKLIEVANYFGFEGWFINQESDTSDEGKLTKEHAKLMQEFIKAFKAKAGELEIMWYDSMTKDGKMDWQNGLTDKNIFYILNEDKEAIADSMFLNFWWTDDNYVSKKLLEASKKMADKNGINPYDIYAGIDVQANGVMTPIRWDLFAPEGQAPYTSLGLYCPSWTYFAANGNYEDFQAKENRLWVNENGDPTVPTTTKDTEWRGVSTYAIEKTVVNQAPFVTNFSLGHGYSYFIDGEKVSEKDWNNRSMQDIMPTYRWTLDQEEGNELKPFIDYANAYYGGNSLKFFGTAAKDKTTTVKLYSSDLAVTKDLAFTAKAKANSDANLSLIAELDDGSVETIKGDKKVGAEWTDVSFDISKLDGKTIRTISVGISAAADAAGFEFNLGQLAVTDKADAPEATAADLAVESTSFDEDDCIYTGVRLAWTGSDAAYYEVYRVNQDKTTSFLGATPGTNLYINALERNDDTNKTNFQVVPVNVKGERGKATDTVTMEWPDNSLPKADFKASKTLVAPGEEITFESLCSANTENVSWEFTGADTETSTDAAPKVTYANEGTYTVKVTAKNDSGEAVEEKENLITVSSKVSGDLTLLSQGKKTEASAYVNENEAPQFAVDGDPSKKWCATGNPPHTLTIDLGAVQTVSEVKIGHAEFGGEGPDMNTKAYTIQVSKDGKEFTDVIKVKKNSLGETLDTFQAVEAQFVKLIVEKPTQGSDTAARIYEVSVFGLEGSLN
ncbi:MAG: discoidin domain-containing protein [Lachnospiraceae bacterium]|nr:discoidin domain-containing protein [Lachnospiraceae bacterium]